MIDSKAYTFQPLKSNSTVVVNSNPDEIKSILITSEDFRVSLLQFIVLNFIGKTMISFRIENGNQENFLSSKLGSINFYNLSLEITNGANALSISYRSNDPKIIIENNLPIELVIGISNKLFDVDI